VLFEMLTGKRLFEGETAATPSPRCCAPIRLEPLPADPRRAAPLITRCLERNPRLRLRDIGEARIWSPDDSRIGFFTWSHLSTTPAAGGPVSRLARARDARGGTWNRQGTILFAPHQVGPLLTIPAGGGEARPATAIEGGDREGTHRFPQFLPDGEHFLYLARSAQAGPGSGAAVTLGRLGAAEPVARLVEGATNAVFADGHLLFARDGALVAQPLDLERGALVGEAKTLVGDLLFNLRFSFGVFSASEGGLLAFLTGHQSDRSQLVWRDRAGRRLGELGAPGVLSGLGGLALSLDGRWAAVSRIEEGTSDADVWIYDLTRGTETRLARPGVDDSTPVFAPDGSALYLNSRDGVRSSAIVRRDLATGAVAELVTSSSSEGDILPMAVSPDGAWLLYDHALGAGRHGRGVQARARHLEARPRGRDQGAARRLRRRRRARRAASRARRRSWPRSTTPTSPRSTGSRRRTGVRALVMELVEGEDLARA
jgi:hypothetical protein